SSVGKVDAVFTLSLSSPTTELVSVDYVTSNGTATAGSDYGEKGGTISFSPGQVERTLEIEVKGNTLDEETENFFVNLSHPVNATLGRTKGVGTILNKVASQAPEIGPLLNQSTLEDHPIAAVNFSISDTETPAAQLLVNVVSSDPILIPPAGILLGGADMNRT